MEYSTSDIIALSALGIALLSLISSYFVRAENTKIRKEENKRELITKLNYAIELNKKLIADAMYLKEQCLFSEGSVDDMREHIDDIDKNIFRAMDENLNGLSTKIHEGYDSFNKEEIKKIDIQLDKLISFLSVLPENISKRFLAAIEVFEKYK